MKLPSQSHYSARGFILLEAILSVMILSMIAVSLTVALDRLGAAASASQREMNMMRNLQTLMTWNLRDPFIQPKPPEQSVPDSYGIIYETLIEEMELYNMDEQPLPEMLRIHIRAVWQEGGQMQEETVEAYRYVRLYRNN